MSKAIVIRDAVWGDVDLDPRLVGLIDTRELQRMRGIRQLGTAHLVYPSANHTRFEHLLGTCHVAGRILAGVGEAAGLSDLDALAIQAAALIHDVGHVPFGHTFEDERRIFPRHDGPERTRHFLGATELGDALRSLGIEQQVLSALGATADPRGLAYDVVCGTICADLLDYLARDAHFTGIRRSYDERLFRYFTVQGGRLGLQLSKRGMLRADAVSEVVHLLRLRYTLTERVYFHHTKVSSGALVSKLVERAVAAGLVLDDLYDLSDDGLLLHLERVYAPGDAVLQRLLDDLRRRRIPKRAFVISPAVGAELQADLIRRFHDDRAQREQVESALEAQLGLEPGCVIVSCPGDAMSGKEADVPVDVGGGLVSLATLDLAEVADLRDKHRGLWRFTVLIAKARAERRAELTAACADMFGVESELRFD